MTKPLDPIEATTATRASKAADTTPPQHAAPAGAAPDVQAHPGACANCGTALAGEYCHHCGQYAHNPLTSFKHAVEDVFESLWHLDGRIFRTLRELFVPGRVANRYLAGQRVRYIPPLRLFVVLSLITFFVAHFAIDGDGAVIRMDNGGLGAADTVAEVERIRDAQLATLAAKRKDIEVAPGRVDAIAGLTAAEAAIQAAAESRINEIRKAAAAGTPPPEPTHGGFRFNDKPWDARTNPVRVSWWPPFANDWLNDAIGRASKNSRHYLSDQAALKDAWLGAIPTTLFFLVPIFALLLKLFYVFTPWTYLEHLVVALYSHAFLLVGLLLTAVVALLGRAAGWPNLGEAVGGWMACGLVIYLLVMQKRVYKQAWWLTLGKFFVLGTLYSLLISFGAVFALGMVFIK